MKFQFFGRMPSLNASTDSDGSVPQEKSENCITSTSESQTYRGTSDGPNDDEDMISSIFEWDQIVDNSQIGNAISNVSTISSMIQSEISGHPYDPSTKHSYNFNESTINSANIVDEKCRSKMLEWCFKVRITSN